MRTKKGTGREGSLPEPRALVKGNYILIPFWNLVYIWLPGTSANCLQCLSLCLLGACVLCLCEHTGHTHINIHARRHIQDCQSSWLAQNTAHAGVITMQVDYSIYRHLLSLHSDYFSSACRTGVMLLRAASKRIPQLPCICMKALRCFQSLVFYVYLSDVRNGGAGRGGWGVNVVGWVWVCVLCDIVKRLWERFAYFRFSNRTSKRTQRATCTLQRALRWAKVSTNNSLNDTESLFSTVRLFFFSLLHGNSDLLVKTSANISSVSHQDFSALHAGLWANHLLHKLGFDGKTIPKNQIMATSYRPCYKLDS